MFTHSQPFPDRAAAGAALGRDLRRRALGTPVLVLGLPRGGVAVAREVALALDSPLDVLVVRKITLPENPELAIGAAACGDVVVVEEDVAPRDTRLFERLRDSAREEITRREHSYRTGKPPLDLRSKTVILVDDGLATGATMLAAVRAARQAGAAKIVAAVPVGSHQAAARVRRECDLLVILQTPPELFAVGQHYRNFEQLDDDDVRRLLQVPGQSAVPE